MKNKGYRKSHSLLLCSSIKLTFRLAGLKFNAEIFM